MLHSALVDLYCRTSVYHPHNADFLAAAGAGGARVCRHFQYAHIVFSNLVKVALYQATSPAFEILEQELTALTLDLDDATFRHTACPIQYLARYSKMNYISTTVLAQTLIRLPFEPGGVHCVTTHHETETLLTFFNLLTSVSD